MVTVRGCSKCLGATISSDDGNKCVICGYTDYSTAPTYKIKRTKYKDSHQHATILIRKKGYVSLYHAKSVYVMTFTNGYGNQAFRYEMNCPYDNCKQRCATSRNSHKREFKYKCKNRHIWYLIMKDDEPIYWRY